MCKFLQAMLLIIISVFHAGHAAAQENTKVFDTDAGKIRVEQIAYNLDTPWAMAMLPDGRLLVTLRGGKMVLVGGSA